MGIFAESQAYGPPRATISIPPWRYPPGHDRNGLKLCDLVSYGSRGVSISSRRSPSRRMKEKPKRGNQVCTVATYPSYAPANNVNAPPRHGHGGGQIITLGESIADWTIGVSADNGIETVAVVANLLIAANLLTH